MLKYVYYLYFRPPLNLHPSSQPRGVEADALAWDDMILYKGGSRGLDQLVLVIRFLKKKTHGRIPSLTATAQGWTQLTSTLIQPGIAVKQCNGF